jgi:hypothetical protein
MYAYMYVYMYLCKKGRRWCLTPVKKRCYCCYYYYSSYNIPYSAFLFTAVVVAIAIVITIAWPFVSNTCSSSSSLASHSLLGRLA